VALQDASRYQSEAERHGEKAGQLAAQASVGRSTFRNAILQSKHQIDDSQYEQQLMTSSMNTS
jgi:hypothetical protein